MSAKRIVILAICLIVALIVILPNLVPVHPQMRVSCVGNLRQIQGAKETWALELHKGTNDTPTWQDLRSYFRSLPSCPQGGVYTIGRVPELPFCSITEHTIQYRQHP